MPGFSAVFILDSRGKTLISRNYRGEVPMSISECFVKNVISNIDEGSVAPVFQEDGINYCWIQFDTIYLLAVSQWNSNAMLILTFLHRLASVMKDYFGEVNEESIKDNFVTTHELLDEVMDSGYPQNTEPKVLKDFITTESHKLKLDSVSNITSGTNAVSWRSEGIKHRKNEVFLDVVERVNLLVGAGGQVLRSEILGALKMKSFLSGMPELKLGLNDKALGEQSRKAGGKSVEMEDIKFHQCVRLARFENDRTISFIPPDGEFELMSYRLNTQVKPLIWVETMVEATSAKVEFMVKAKAQFKARSIANNVEIAIPVMNDVDSPKFKTSSGSVKYAPERECFVWTIKQFQGQKELILRAEFGRSSSTDEDDTGKKPISVSFEIPYFTVSGIQVRYLKIIEKSGYQALPWVRYITQNGDYQIRMADK